MANPRISRLVLYGLLLVGALSGAREASAKDDDKTLRVFIFAGQSNMVGSDSKVADIGRFPPFRGLEAPQKKVRFAYCIGREDKRRSSGFVHLQAVDGVVGPELSFAWRVSRDIEAPIAIIKVAAGGTHLGGDWSPDRPIGFKMYPLALEVVRSSLALLDRQKVKYRLEAFMWHQGENDMFEEEYLKSYGSNLRRFVARWRADLKAPKLPFFIGELCTKTVWGMDMRPRMYAVSQGQKAVARADPHARYVPTSHVGVEIGGGAGLHYHYGTLGQLEHGVNYAIAYLESLGKETRAPRPFKKWPFKRGRRVKLFVLAGHRNMEGERAFVQDLKGLRGGAALAKDDPKVAFKYDLGGGARVSDGYEPLGPAGLYDTFGPELSFARALSKSKKRVKDLAIAKFTHSGSQIIDWSPEGSEAVDRNLYPRFVAFVKEAVKELKAKGNKVELAGVFYHLGENDMSFGPYREGACERLVSLIRSSRRDLRSPRLRWFVSQQAPTNHDSVNGIDVTAALSAAAAVDRGFIHIKAFELPGREQALVLTTPGVVELGASLARSYLEGKK